MKKKIVLKNKRARYDYAVQDVFEAGIVLTGAEVKSLRLGKGSMADTHVVFSEDSQAWLVNLTISGYSYADLREYDSTRRRKLLLHKSEIDSLRQKIKGTGMTLVPLSIYLKAGKLKVELGLVRGKKEYEKRETIKKRDLKREIQRDYKQRML